MTRERFDAKWRHDPSGCWIWTAGRQHAYGAFLWADGDSRRAHRVAWQLYRGEIPDGLHVLHHCDVPLCVNPQHLFLGTNADNVRDRHGKGRSGAPTGDRHGSKTRPERIARGERSGRAKLSEDAVREIRRCAAEGQRSGELAARFGITSRAIRLVVLRRTWAHVR